MNQPKNTSRRRLKDYRKRGLSTKPHIFRRFGGWCVQSNYCVTQTGMNCDIYAAWSDHIKHQLLFKNLGM